MKAQESLSHSVPERRVMVRSRIPVPSAGRPTSRALVAAAIAIGTFACAEPGGITAPESAAVLASGPSAEPCTVDQGQQLIDDGQYQAAIQKFTCVIGLDPTAVEGYRGRIEAQLMLGASRTRCAIMRV